MDRRQQTAAAERYREMTRDRKELKRQKVEGTRVVDTPERVRAPGRAAGAGWQLQREALVKAIAPEEYLADRRVADAIGATLR